MGAPVALPGRIEAENYDHGGAGVAYADLTAGNSGGEYRTDDVDLERVEGSAQDYNVGWMVAGEWLQYTVNVVAAGSYTLEAVVASSGGGGTFHLDVNGIARTGAISVPDTGGWQQWQTVTIPATLDAGLQRLRVVLDTNGSSGRVGNLNYLRLTTLSPPPPPPSKPPVASFTSSCSTLTCAFDGSASSAADGMITSYQWDFGDGSGGSGASVNHTYPAPGTYTVALAVRDSLGQVNGQRRDVTVVAAAAHVGDIDQAVKKQSSLWTATVTIEIHGGSHAPLANATVRGSWTDGSTASCVTNGAGRCSLTLPGIARSQSSVRFTVSSVTHALGYEPDNNHDPDADSNGITIIVKRP